MIRNRFTNPDGTYRSPTRAETVELFWSKVKIGSDSECWEWQAGGQPSGYGQFSVGGLPFKSGLAHRWAYWLTHGEAPNVVSHTCNNPPCVNPTHLSNGTQSDNEAHKDVSGRRPVGVKGLPCPHCGGEQTGRSKRTGANGGTREFAFCRPCRKEYLRAYYQNRKAV